MAQENNESKENNQTNSKKSNSSGLMQVLLPRRLPW